jgi:hypothetical protein
VIEDGLINKVHVVSIDMILVIAKYIWEFADDPRVIAFGLTGHELNFVHEWIGPGEQVFYTNDF